MEFSNGMKSGEIPSTFIQKGHAAKLLERYAPDKSIFILDAGCGGGSFLSELKNKGYKHLYGLDIVPFDWASLGLGAENIKVLDASWEKLPWPDSFFDAVTSWEVFEHLENPRFLKREIYRVLKPGGVFMLSMPNAFHILNRLFFFKKGDFIRWSGRNDHYNIFTRKVFKKIFLNDFELLEEFYAVPSAAQGLSGWWQRLKFLDQYLPENQTFSNFVGYVLKTKKPPS